MSRIRLLYRPGSCSGCMLRVSLVLALASYLERLTAFAPGRLNPRKPTGWCLFMGKGFNSARNKQAEMARKMEIAKKQQHPNEDDIEIPEGRDEEDAKEKEDRAIFAELLAKSQPAEKKKQHFRASTRTTDKKRVTPSVAGRDKVKKRAADRKRRKKDRPKKGEGVVAETERPPLREGDVAARSDFEHLIPMETGTPLGPMGAAQLVPWVPPYLTDYLVVLADPRRQSADLRQAVQYLTSNLESEPLSQVIAISADPNEVTSSWMKRSGVDTSVRFFSDEKLQWMTSYSAMVDDERWCLSAYLFCTSGVIKKLERPVDPSQASQLVMDMIQSVEE